MRTGGVRAALILAAACAPAPAPGAARERERGWREVATPDDRRRLRGWRTAWLAALAAARAGGGAAAIAADPALFDPDRALRDATPPPGPYRCRTFRLGSQGTGAPRFVAGGRAGCRVWPDGRFSRLEGPQRPVGAIHPDTTARAVFLGTAMLGEERKPIRYGRDRERDMAGIVERIGAARWRIVLPYPRFGPVLELIELVPEGSVGATGGGTTASGGATGGAGSGGSAAR